MTVAISSMAILHWILWNIYPCVFSVSVLVWVTHQLGIPLELSYFSYIYILQSSNRPSDRTHTHAMYICHRAERGLSLIERENVTVDFLSTVSLLLGHTYTSLYFCSTGVWPDRVNRYTFKYTLLCGHLVHEYFTLYSLLVFVGRKFQHVTIYQFFKLQMDCCKAIKSSAIFGLRVRERERVMFTLWLP